jgi:hypothetical protein
MNWWAAMFVDLIIVLLVAGMLAVLAINIVGVFGTALLPMSVQQLGNGFNDLQTLSSEYANNTQIQNLVSSIQTNMVSIVNNQVQGTVNGVAGINQAIQFFIDLLPVIVILILAGVFIGIVMQFAGGTYYGGYRQVTVGV